MLGVVYRASSLNDPRSFISQSRLPLRNIAHSHFAACAKLRTTGISEQPDFHSALLRYGFENFYWEVLVECETQALLDYNERLAREYYKDRGGLYNTDIKLTIAVVAQRTGKKRSEESRANMRKPHRKFTPEGRRNMSLVKQGKPRSEETKKKISEGCLLAMTSEAKKARSDTLMGRRFTYASMQKMSAAAKLREERKRLEKTMDSD